jgi:hypothetical protein
MNQEFKWSNEGINLIEKREIKWKINELKILRVEWLKNYSKSRQMRVKLWIRNLNDEMKNQLNWTKRNQMKNKRTQHIFKSRVYPWLQGCVVKTCFYLFTKGWKFLNYWMTVKWIEKDFKVSFNEKRKWNLLKVR